MRKQRQREVEREMQVAHERLRSKGRERVATTEAQKDTEMRETARRYAIRQRQLTADAERKRALHTFHETRREAMFAQSRLDETAISELQHLNTRIAHMSGKRRMLTLQNELERHVAKIEAVQTKEELRAEAPRRREQLLSHSVELRRRRAAVVRKNLEANLSRVAEERQRKVESTMRNMQRHEQRVQQQRAIRQQIRRTAEQINAYQAHQKAEITEHYKEIERTALDRAHSALGSSRRSRAQLHSAK
eukprot:a176235_71.p1 GENE.a176235_71~~a176235_71.p1  ORF type:complete len:288 (-),score=74.43 a176235_71:18-761(-)